MVESGSIISSRHAGMDYSFKPATTTTEAAAAAAAVAEATIAESQADRGQNHEIQIDQASSPLEADQQNGTLPCPICPVILSNAHELSCHIRGHNSPRSTDGSVEDEYACQICNKVLSSASSLDRHAFVHSLERPFKCIICGVAFTTNGNMNRHRKSAHRDQLLPGNSSTDSEASSDSDKSNSHNARRRNMAKGEYNNNEVAKASPPESTVPREVSDITPKRKRTDINQRGNSPSYDAQMEHKTLLNSSRTETKPLTEFSMSNNCPICENVEFATNALLESHLEREHPDFVPKCEACNLSFKSHRMLNLHKFMRHMSDTALTPNAKSLRNSVVGFHDLTFVDFSSSKFPTIARAVCEQSVHRPVSGEIPSFQCAKCQLAFPCKSSLDAHEVECGVENQQNRSPDDDHTRRNDFFAGLDLQNKAALAEAKEGKDLADIQSIISVTSGPILQNFPRSDASTPEHQTKVKTNVSSSGSSGSSGTPSSSSQQTEETRAFSLEFRKMKVKGEFPCKLCPEVFPNLRALKGHNRSHLVMKTEKPYPCNMCDYISEDKTLLIRHMRSHNGDRPFQCRLCGYAFTTKANCERHLRNRHGKMTREEIKAALVYHPNEDSTNDETRVTNSPVETPVKKPNETPDDARKALVYAIEHEDNVQRMAFYNAMNPDNRHDRGSVSDEGRARSVNMQASRASSSLGHYERSEGPSRIPNHGANSFDLRGHGDERYARRIHINYETDSESSEDESVSLVSDTRSDVMHQRVEASPRNLRRSPAVNFIPAATVAAAVEAAVASIEEPSTSGSGEDAPLDLSMDVLDLSKKPKKNANAAANSAAASTSTSASAASTSNSASSASSSSSANVAVNHNQLYDATKQYLLTQALLKARQATAPSRFPLEALYANAQMMCRSFPGFAAAGVGAGIVPPYLFNPQAFGQDLAMKNSRLQKELVRGLQLTSGGNIVEPTSRNSGFPGAYPQPRVPEPPVQQRIEPPSTLVAPPSMLVSPQIPSQMINTTENLDSSSSSVKMVIKNGVLMPKQKQRRYRTERPFVCEYCKAKFTLRSNMERHVKQQHPDFWSLKPKGAQSTRGRPPANPPTLLPTVNPLGNQQQPAQQAELNVVPNVALRAGPSSAPDGNERRPISDQVKYAILAQQLKGNRAEDNDTDDEELVIDEGANDRENGENNEPAESQRSSSLLRGKLEENNSHNDRQQQQQQQQPQTRRGAKRNAAKDDENDGSDEADGSGDDRPTRRMKIEHVEQNHEDNSTDCSPSETSAMEVDRDEQTFRGNASERNGDGSADLASVSELLDNASQQYQQFHPQYISDEEGLVASTSDCNVSGSDEKSDTANSGNSTNSASSTRRRRKLKKKKKKKKKKSAYSSAPNRVICPYCQRPFPWTSSLRRHILTHTGQKPYQCIHCNLLFTTKSNCDRHLLRKHKNNVIKMRRMRNAAASPRPRTPANNNNNNNNSSSSNNNSTPFAMRNVPERPYKCNLCPSSTFSTLGNLKKHKASKHSRRCANRGSRSSGPDSPGTSGQNSPVASNTHNEHSGYESQSSGVSDNAVRVETVEIARTVAEANTENTAENANNVESNRIVVQVEINAEPRITVRTPEIVQAPIELRRAHNVQRMETADIIESAPLPIDVQPSTSTETAPRATSEPSKSRRPSPRSSPGPADGPFKCHLCDSGFSERQDCLDHIRINHTRSYQVLVAKGALDMDIETPEEQQQTQPPHHQSDGEERRGRFPDYSNRKVVCAFCMRRFWSAEDLRRHMRTHTGERPFSCDICLRRFTLKHSMLRHRKKHESVDSTMYVGTSGDEEAGPSQPPTITPRSQQQQQQQQHTSLIGATSGESRIQERISLPTVATVATGDAAPSGLMRHNPYESLTTLTGTLTTSVQHSFPASDGADTENDLISNLLDIRDKSLIDKVLQASPDDAAKLLGVQRND